MRRGGQGTEQTGQGTAGERFGGKTDKEVIVSCASHGCGELWSCELGCRREGAWKAAGCVVVVSVVGEGARALCFRAGEQWREDADFRVLSRSQWAEEPLMAGEKSAVGLVRQVVHSWVALPSQIAAWGRTTSPDLHPTHRPPSPLRHLPKCGRKHSSPSLCLCLCCSLYAHEPRPSLSCVACRL